MVDIRELKYTDIQLMLELHNRYFSMFDPPEFLRPNLGGFVITNKNEYIMGGIIRPIAETLLVTDLSKSRVVIGRALIEALKFSKFATKHAGIQFLHAFVKNEEYAKHLIQHGFSERCKALSIEV